MEPPTYWRKQTTTQPLFPDIEWSRPERRDQAGKLGIIGGNKLSFAGVADSYTSAKNSGAGEVRVLLPDSLKRTIPPSISDTIFAPSVQSGSLSRDAIDPMRALGAWADVVLMAGDAGRNSETAVVYEGFISDYTGPLVLTRDAIDLVKNSATLLVDRPDTVIVASFAQVQKLFQSVYYPKVLTFRMPLLALVEALHKFTITYPVELVVLHGEQIIIARDGDVVTQPWDSPMRVWRGETAAHIASYWLWNLRQPFEASVASIAKSYI